MIYAGAAALVLMLGGCLPEIPQKNPYLLEPPPAPEGIREIPHTFALRMISGRAAKSVDLRVFDTGTIRARGEAVSSLKSYGAKIKMAAPAFLVRHSAEGLVLIGTGLSPEKKRRPSAEFLHAVRYLASLDYGFRYKQKRKQNLVSQLVRAGVDPADVKWLVVPYWDATTVGMLDAFPGAVVVISRREWEWRSSKTKEGRPPGPLDPQAFKDKIKLRLVDLASEPAFGAFDNGHDLFGDKSLVLVSLPGRTPGNMGVWVNLDRGPALFTGGAAFVVDNYLDLALPVKGKIHDLEDYWRSLHIVQAMMKAVPRLVVIPGNDLTPLKLAGTRPDIKTR
ncbi:MAG: hypothetical protein V3S11_02710 [Elusimicrobiota bacterium]